MKKHPPSEGGPPASVRDCTQRPQLQNRRTRRRVVKSSQGVEMPRVCSHHLLGVPSYCKSGDRRPEMDETPREELYVMEHQSIAQDDHRPAERPGGDQADNSPTSGDGRRDIKVGKLVSPKAIVHHLEEDGEREGRRCEVGDQQKSGNRALSWGWCAW